VKSALHQFRHTSASELVANGEKMRHGQKLLGHRAITSTMGYLHIAGPELALAMRRHPICDLRPAVAVRGVEAQTTDLEKEDFDE
jgi:integrase